MFDMFSKIVKENGEENIESNIYLVFIRWSRDENMKHGK